MNNTLIVDYLQEARVRYFASSPATRSLTTDGVVVVAHQVEYHAPVDFSREPLRVEVGIDEVGGSKIAIGYDLYHAGRSVATARSLVCAFDLGENRPRRLPEAPRSALRDVAAGWPPLRGLGAHEIAGRYHVHPVSVRWTDQDVYGHVNNVRFFDYVAEARIHMTTDADASAARMGAAAGVGHLWLIARQDVEYLRQVRYRPETYEVRTAVARIGRTSVTLVAEIHDPVADAVCARAHTVLVCADTAGRPVELPAALVANLGAYTL